MIEPVVVVLRLLQYAGAAVLFGSSLFFLYALPATGPGSASAIPWARPLVAASATVLALSALLAIGAQASLFTGSFAEGFQREAILAVVGSMDLGKAAVVRAAAAAAAACVVAMAPARGNWRVACALGAIATASLAWMGHGAASEGTQGLAHLSADVLHSLAAAIWVGALVAFALQVRREPDGAVVHASLRRFSAIGIPLVALLIATGLVNTWFVVGFDGLSGLLTTPYGQVLAAKLALFAAMLGLAAANRYRFTPAMARANAPFGPVTRSLTAEALLGFVVLGLVAWLGTLAPPNG